MKMAGTQQVRSKSAVLLWLLTVNLGIALGAGLYESRVVISDWPSASPSQWPNTGTRFWAYVTTVPLTTLTVLNAVAAWRDRSPRRQSWLTSVGIAACERAVTFGYFIPTMVDLMGRSTLDAEVLGSLNQWMTLNYGRHLLTFAAWLFALRALSTPGNRDRTTSSPGRSGREQTGDGRPSADEKVA
jgi:hypothetical protein